MGWVNAAASDGVYYDIYRQDKDNSCACACIAMVAKLVKNKTLDESSVRNWVAEAEGGHRKSKEGVREFDRTGTWDDCISAVLQKIDVDCFPVKGDANVVKWMGSVKAHRPAIVHVSWVQYNFGIGAWEYDGSGHSVVAVKVHNGNVIFLDPGEGVVEVPVVDGSRYTVTYGAAAGPSYGYMTAMRTTS